MSKSMMQLIMLAICCALTEAQRLSTRHWRFRLRTLLAYITLLAIALLAIIYASK